MAVCWHLSGTGWCIRLEIVEEASLVARLRQSIKRRPRRTRPSRSLFVIGEGLRKDEIAKFAACKNPHRSAYLHLACRCLKVPRCQVTLVVGAGFAKAESPPKCLARLAFLHTPVPGSRGLEGTRGLGDRYLTQTTGKSSSTPSQQPQLPLPLRPPSAATASSPCKESNRRQPTHTHTHTHIITYTCPT